MANRNLAPIKGSLDRGLVVMAGQILIDAGGDVLSDTVLGAEASNTDDGIYRLALEDQWNELKACQATVESLTNQELFVQVLSADVVTDKFVDLKLVDGSGAPAIPDDACNIHVTMVLKNSSVLP